MFPEGLSPELRPGGAGQIAATTTLRDRLTTHPAAVSVKAALADRLDKALEKFMAVIEARQAAEAEAEPGPCGRDGGARAPP